MKNNTLVLIDWVAGLIISPAIIFVKAAKKIAARVYRPKRDGRLIIKFLGAGNYVAMCDVIDNDTTLISAVSNKAAIERFLNPKAVFYIDDTGFFSLVRTAVGSIFFVLTGSFHEVINLETESKFSKLLTTLARSEETLGLTNIHKSYLDALIYDRYLVNPIMVSKSDVIRLLTKFELVVNKYALEPINKSQRDFMAQVSFGRTISKVVFAPAGSDTNTLRRLAVDVWVQIANKIFAKFRGASIDLVFPSMVDWQYQSMKQAFALEPRCTIKIGSYSDYLNVLKGADLIVCIDSQSLHIGSRLGVPVVCFFGPTSPYGVNHASTVYPISKAAMCSPCMHKYFDTPCKNKAICMEFSGSDLDVFDRLDELCA